MSCNWKIPHIPLHYTPSQLSSNAAVSILCVVQKHAPQFTHAYFISPLSKIQDCIMQNTMRCAALMMLTTLSMSVCVRLVQ